MTAAGDIGLGCGRGTTQRAYRKGAEPTDRSCVRVFWKSLCEDRGRGGGVGGLIRIGDVLCDVG